MIFFYQSSHKISIASHKILSFYHCFLGIIFLDSTKFILFHFHPIKTKSFYFISIHFFPIYFLSNHPKQVEDFKLYVIDIKMVLCFKWHSNWIWLKKVTMFLIKKKKLGLKMYTLLEGAIKFKHKNVYHAWRGYQIQTLIL